MTIIIAELLYDNVKQDGIIADRILESVHTYMDIYARNMVGRQSRSFLTMNPRKYAAQRLCWIPWGKTP